MADAPRFRLWWGRVERTSVLTMPRQEWTTLVGSMGAPVAFDVRETPIGGVAQASSVVATVAHKFDAAKARVSVFRYDEADAPTPINQDEYDVWLDLEKHGQLYDWIVQASTSYDENFRQFASENVFLVKRQPGPEHWLASVPSSITVLVKKS